MCGTNLPLKWLGVAVGGITIMSMGPGIIKNIELSSFSIVIWRLTLAIVPYVIWFLAAGDRPSWSDVKAAAPGGAFFGLNLLAFFTAVVLTSAANAVVIGALQPIVLLVAAGPLFGESPSKAMYGWATVAVVGVIISVNSGLALGTGNLMGDGLALLAMFTFAGYYLGSKQARKKLNTPLYMALMMGVALAVTLPIVLATEGSVALPTGSDWWWLILMAGGPGTGHFALNATHAYLPLSWTGLVGLLSPGIAAFFAWVLAGEAVSLLQVVGMAVTVGALSMLVARDLVLALFGRGRHRGRAGA